MFLCISLDASSLYVICMVLRDHELYRKLPELSFVVTIGQL